MNHVPFPFEKRGVLIFKNSNPDEIEELTTEIAESTMEVFQALSYREYSDFKESLLLHFTDPQQQHFVMFGYDFFLKVITVGLNNVISNIFDLEKRPEKGYFIKSFSGLKMVLLTKPTSCIYHTFNVKKNHTVVELMTDIDYWYKSMRPRWIKEFQSKSDHELIESLNNRVGKGHWGYARRFYFALLQEEILARSFNSEIIFSGRNGYYKNPFERKVKLINNRLEFIDNE